MNALEIRPEYCWLHWIRSMSLLHLLVHQQPHVSCCKLYFVPVVEFKVRRVSWCIWYNTMVSINVCTCVANIGTLVTYTHLLMDINVYESWPWEEWYLYVSQSWASLGVSTCSKTLKFCIYILDQNKINKYIFLFLNNSF